MAKKTPTKQLYDTLDKAFNHFNRTLFSGDLPPALITVARKRGAHGYFWANVFKDRGEGKAKLDEICLNPDGMNRDAAIVISTLAHEMAHHWQQHHGKPGKGPYHNKQWVEKMLEIGLQPISPNGKGTGTKVGHEIIEDGAFEKSFATLKDARLDWASVPRRGDVRPQSRHKIVCPDCGQKVWGTDKNSLVCGECNVPMKKEGEE